MAYEQIGHMWSQNAGADLSAKLFHLAVVDTDEDVILAGDGEAVVGVIFEAAVQDRPVTLQLDGIAKCICGGSFNAGTKVASDANGQIVTATTGEFIVGIALQAGAANRIVAVKLGPYGRAA